MLGAIEGATQPASRDEALSFAHALKRTRAALPGPHPVAEGADPVPLEGWERREAGAGGVQPMVRCGAGWGEALGMFSVRPAKTGLGKKARLYRFD
jgi:hypothetical protein